MIKTHQWGDAAALFAFVLLTRTSLCFFPPAWGLVNGDEIEAALAGVDHWLGVPSVALAWPSGMTQFLLQPIILLGFLFHLPGAPQQIPAAFAHYISGIYLEPAGIITAVRLMSAGFSALGVACIYLIGREINIGRAASLCATVFWLVSPIAVQHSTMATGDAIAWALAILSILVLLKWPRQVAAAGAVMGCAVASKITVSSLVLLHLSMILVGTGKRPHKLLDAACFLLGVAFAFAFLCPQVWLEPVRLGKALVGNWFLVGASSEELLIFNTSGPDLRFGLAVATILLGVPTVIGAAARRPVTVPLLVAAGFMFLPLALGPAVRVRYAVPLLIPLSILAGVAYEEFISRRNRIVRMTGATAVAATCAVLSWFTVYDQRRLRNPDALRPLLAQLETCSASHQTILLPGEFFGRRFWAFPASRESWQAMLPPLAGGVVASPALMEFLDSRGLPAEFSRVFLNNFNEKEQVYHARVRAMSALDNPKGCTLKFYFRPGPDQASTGSQRLPLNELEEDDAIRRFENSPDNFILVTDTVPNWWQGQVLRYREARGLSGWRNWYVLGSVNSCLTVTSPKVGASH